MATKTKTTKPATPLGQVVLIDARLSFPNLAQKKSFDGNDDSARFSANFLIEKGSDNEARIREAGKAVIADKWKKKPAGLKVCLREAGEKTFDGYDDDHLYVSSSNKRRPACVDNLKVPVEIDRIEEVFYAGCRVDAVVRLWAQDNKFGKRLNASLEAVKFRRHDEPFGGQGVDTDSVFDANEDVGERVAPTGGGRREPEDEESAGDESDELF